MASRGDIFNFIQNVHKKRTKFDMSFDRGLSVNMGELTPCFCREVLPGDTWKMGVTPFIRFAPMLAPIMSRVDVKVEFWYVPNRLLWTDWNDFIFGPESGELSPSYPRIPLLDFINNDPDWFVKNSLANNLGLPAFDEDVPARGVDVSALPFRAYHFIWNRRYRDENLQDEVPILETEGGDMDISWSEDHPEFFAIHRRAWKKDYFSSCLPFAQKGEQVSIPLVGSAPVSADSNGFELSNSDGLLWDSMYGAGLGGYDGESFFSTAEDDDSVTFLTTQSLDMHGDRVAGIRGSYVEGLTADLSDVSAVTINDLRKLARLQEFLEAKARGGSRPKEALYQMFGVISADARLQDPEYLGGGSVPVQISEVLQQAPKDSDSRAGVGDMYGHGIAAGSFMGIKKHTFTEHGWIIGLITVMPRAAYSQGIERQWTRFDQLDHPWPHFAQIGEQEVKNKEIYAVSEDPEGTFGYQSRYAECKYIPDSWAGDFTDELQYWHLGRTFANTPTLSGNFVECNPRTNIFAVTDQAVKHVWVSLFFNGTARRCLPKFGTPSLT